MLELTPQVNLSAPKLHNRLQILDSRPMACPTLMLAAGGRTREAVDEDLSLFTLLDLDWEACWRAEVAFCRAYPNAKEHKPVLPDFPIRGQAAALGCRHLTNDRSRLAAFPELEILFPQG